MSEYPNLELIEYKFYQMLLNREDWIEKFTELKKQARFLRPEFVVKVFQQTWGSTATAFDVMPDGSASFGGCAMTSAYTTVIHEVNTDYYGVYIGNKPCYVVFDPTDVFYEDYKSCNMKSMSGANKYY